MSDQTLIVDSPDEKKVTELRIAQNKGQPFHEVETRGLIRAGIDYCLCARHSTGVVIVSAAAQSGSYASYELRWVKRFGYVAVRPQLQK